MANKISFSAASITVSLCCSYILFSNAAFIVAEQELWFGDLLAQSLLSVFQSNVQTTCDCQCAINVIDSPKGPATGVGNCNGPCPSKVCEYRDDTNGLHYVATNDCPAGCNASWNAMGIGNTDQGVCNGQTCHVNATFMMQRVGEVESGPCQ